MWWHHVASPPYKSLHLQGNITFRMWLLLLTVCSLLLQACYKLKLCWWYFCIPNFSKQIVAFARNNQLQEYVHYIAQTYIFKASHEVVADRWSWQVSRVGAPSDVEEVVRAQHGVILLGVTSGGQYTVHWNGHLAWVWPIRDRWRRRRRRKREVTDAEDKKSGETFGEWGGETRKIIV